MSSERVLIISHAHPDFSLGGAEISAHAHWLELRRRGVAAILLARVDDSIAHLGAPFMARSAEGDEMLFGVPPVNHFIHSQPHGSLVFEHLTNLLERFRPTAVHFHHYVHLGLELIRLIRNFDPAICITVTLHEFLAICHAQGQMLKTNGTLCRKAAPVDCHACFPDLPAQDFFMRELFIKSFFNLVDHFVCPSQFLCDRYIEWGLPREKMVVLENGQARLHKTTMPVVLDQDLERRFVVLGQLSRLKGTLVLLDAIRLLPKKLRRAIRVEIHGSVQYADDEFRSLLASGLSELSDTVRLCGAYLPEHVIGIIRRNGWVIVPSIWWENSPVVIQEAFAAGRPVICSNIGGMAEKVADGVSGFHFRVNSAGDLASRIEVCAARRDLWESMCAKVPEPPSIEDTVSRLLGLYANRGGHAIDHLQKLPDGATA
jgi:glycosyltransferase involved in cell wall biosynthesis